MDLLNLEPALGFLALIFLYKLWFMNKAVAATKKRNEAPQPAGAWPIIGHLPLLGGQPNMGRVLGALANKLGPVFMLRLGVHPTLVVCSWEVAKECFTTNDKALATRPASAAGKHMGYNYAMVGFAAYGSYWRDIRKIASSELLSNSRIETYQHVRASEVDLLAKDLYGRWVKNHRRPVTIEMKQRFEELTFNVVVRIVAGKRCFGASSGGAPGDADQARRFIRGITRLFVLMGTFVASDVLPFLGWMDLWGHERAMKRNAAEMDSIIDSWLQEHKLKRKSTGKVDGNLDFMDVMLFIMEKEHFSTHDPDTIIKANSLAMIIGGTDTTRVSLTWAMALLLNHPHVLKKAQNELDAEVGRERNVEENDIKNLVYLQAIVKEAFRLYPAAPTLVPHEAVEDCRLGGFDVLAGTRLLVNVWSIQRDPRVWSNPSEFMPERFLDGAHANVDVRGQHFELLPFGSGRRACPGISFSLQIMHLTLARLIHGFDIGTPSDAPVDMTEGAGTTLPKATPLEVTFTPRLPSNLYV